MDQNTFDLILNQLQDLKRDIHQAKSDIMHNLKARDEYYNQFRLDVRGDIDQHESDIQTLKKASWTVAGVACTGMVILEIGFRAFDYWLLHK